jgi:death-on-curing family protein
MPDQDEPKPSTEVRSLTMQDLLVAHGVLADVFAEDPEPIPTWEQGSPSLLATCRAYTEVEALGYRKYPDLPSAAAKLFYSTCKLHAFPNGNKRFALVVTIFLIVKNKARLTAGQGVSAAAAERVADSDPHSHEGAPDRMIADLTDFFRENLEPREAEPNGDSN